MNMNQPDPGGLFEPLKQKQQAPAATTSVISQLQNRPAPSGSLPRVNVPDSAIATPQAGQPAPSTNPLVELSRSGKLKELLAMKAQQMQQQQAAPPQNPLVQLAQNGGIRKLILAKEDQQYEQALTDYEQWQQSPYRTMGAGGLRGALTRKAPEPPARSFDEIESDWNRGIQHLRGSELGKMLNTLETGQMTPEQEARITQHIEPQLPPDIRKQLQIARLTRDKLETLSQSAAQEEQAAEAFGQKSLYMTPGQIARDQDFSKMSETGNVFWRNVGHELTLGHGFAPDEDRLNSADADVAADERAKRLFYRQQNAKYPVSAFAGSVLGAAPHIAATGMALRGARVANAMRSVKAGVPTQQAANVIASKGAATTTGGRVAMGAAEGAAFDIARRPEGAEDMTLTENLAARAQQVGFGAALGSLAELGLIKGGNLVGWIKDKRINGQLRKEAEAAGYGSDVDGYLNDQLNIERTDDGRYLFRAKRGAVTDLPDLEPVPHEAGTLAAADQPDTLRFDTGSEPPATGQPATGAPQPEVTTGAVHPPPVSEPADLAGLGGQGPAVPPQSAERAGTGETPPPVAGRTQSPVERVTTIRGTPVDVEYQLVDVDDLTTSHIGTGVTNPDYPAELQPRDRTRVASEANLLDMANNLRPEWLGRSPKASDGAPIVGDDSVVESGNGRVSALRYAYALGKGEDYREWLKANADQFGLDAATIDGMNKPVLVRRRTTPMDMEQRAQFTREANQSDLAGLSASEQARMDANRLTDDDIMMFAPDESGNINTAANAPFLRRFIDRVGRLEAGSMVDSQGRPNADMVQRIQAAIFKRAYDDDRLLSLMAETTGADMRSEAARNMLSALNRAAPSFARARAFGDIPAESDFIPNLMEAVDLVRQSRRNNQALSEVISQGSLLEPVDPVTQELAMFFDANLRSSQRMGDVLKDLGQQLEQEVMRGGDDLFGAGPARKEDFVANLKRRNQPDEQGLHEQPGEIIPEPETAARPGQPGRPEAEPVPAETGTGSGAGEPAGTGRTATGDAGTGENAPAEYPRNLNSEPEAGANSTRIHVETPDGSTEIPVSQNADGSITADGKKIPKGGAYVTNTHKGKTAEQELSGGTLYSNPVNLAIRQMAASMNLGQSAASAFGGGVYGATTENDIGSEQWWLAVMGGAAAGVFGSAALRYNKVIGKDSLLSNFTRFLGQQYERIPGLGRGSPEIRRLKKQQQLMRQIINRQTGQVGEFLARNFTPAERAEMADIIENRGYPKQMNLVARQAKELDDFIAYTSERMKELGMLDPGTETGGYLHRYYTRHLKLDMADDLKKAFKVAKKQSLSGSYSIRRGTEETFSAEYLSPAVREQLAEYDRIHTEIKALEKKAGDLVAAQTDDEILALKDQLKGLQDIGLKEYIGVQNGKPRSFIFMPDEVPTIPGLDQPASRQQPMTDNLFSETGQRLQLENTMANQPMPTDRTWSLRGMAGDQPVLWRDWTKAEREKWGEIQDAGYRFVRGQAEVAHDLSMSTMFHKISQRSDWVSDTPRTIDGEDWIEVPDTKIHKTSPLRKYGALSGKYVKPDVWRAMRYYNQPLFGRGRAATVYRNMLDRWKIYKTVYNPVSHFNNAVSNLQMYYMAGYSARNLGNSLAELRKGENSQLWREARDVGLFGSDWTSSLTEGGEKANSLNELAELLRNQPDMPDADVVVDSLSAINRFKEWWIESRNAVRDADGKLASGAALARSVASPTLGVLNKPIKKATDSAKWLYQKEDELFKLAVFIEERNKGVKPFEAMEAANRFFFDYNDLPDIVRKVKDFPIGSPFISYTYLALPAIVRNAVERPEHMLALAAGFEAVNYASLALDGKLQEDGYWDRMEAENTLNPSWQKGRTMWGALNNIDISGFKPGLDSYKISLANAHAMGNPFAGEGVKDLPLWPDFMAFWGPDPIGGNPVTRIPFDILMNQNWKGEPLYTESDKYEQSLKYAYQAIFPSMPLFPGGWHNKKVIEGMAGDIDRAKEAGEEPNRLAEGIVQAANAVSEALGGEQFTGVDWKGNQFKTQDALAGSVGVKLRPYRAKDLYGYQVNKVVMDMKEESLSYKRKVRGNYTKAQMAQMKQAYKERMDKHREKLDAIKQAYQVIK